MAKHDPPDEILTMKIQNVALSVTNQLPVDPKDYPYYLGATTSMNGAIESIRYWQRLTKQLSKI
jgi:hypothetical protein